jgi:5,10-methylenetetrahydromethanopterin reductase
VKLSLYVGERRDLPRLLVEIERAERLGLDGVWLPETAAGVEPLTVLAVAAQRTQRIALGAGIVHTWPRHPLVLARQALTVQAAAGGRFSLGIGVGHRQLVEGPLGLRWRAPAAHMAEYAAIVADLLREGRTSRAGHEYCVDAALDIEARPPVGLVVAALGERMCRVAGAVADGVMTWLAPPAYVAGTVLPAVAAGAAAAGRETPRVIAALPTAVEADVEAVRAGMNAAFGFMARAPAYAAAVEGAGVARAGDDDGWSDEAIDAVALWGDERALAERVRALQDAGADEVVCWPFATGDDAAGSLTTTTGALGRLVTQTRGAIA